jgi:hypothetical protein
MIRAKKRCIACDHRQLIVIHDGIFSIDVACEKCGETITARVAPPKDRKPAGAVDKTETTKPKAKAKAKAKSKPKDQRN